ncbi:MAG: class I SAM-dependent methyltransferase [Deltaproteobacteria bacterium]
MTTPIYAPIVSHYESCLEAHGDSHRGVDWPNLHDAERRYQVMLELAPRSHQVTTLLDFGCGLGHLYDHMVRMGRRDLAYRGLDVSPSFVEAARTRRPKLRFDVADVLSPDAKWEGADWIVMNGVFTEKRELPHDAMFAYMLDVLDKVWAKTRRGLAFNVMSKVVDWERDDLFHVSMDSLAAALVPRVGRTVTFRHDYGLYELTVYLRRR